MLRTLLTILTLAERPPDMLPTLLTILTLAECTPNMLHTMLTILTLAECPPDMLPTPPITRVNLASIVGGGLHVAPLGSGHVSVKTMSIVTCVT
ncbi:hypothetical protein O181_106295 [Austropuccinia psidii MF-1]|uniref:Uncharacterized protein n=1 Tax=Austropuccinia psidii MF-1 TaxID=1389203 RepID=A0A9Q3JND9_9BASI|nr:hypothetical protein [Austropuccinia psidii MF-1]